MVYNRGSKMCLASELMPTCCVLLLLLLTSKCKALVAAATVHGKLGKSKPMGRSAG